ncbi:MAG: DUF3662 domain-containing protein [Coriobacteriia bacterium]|nr:DUF3662 domain-containing protein [Coriobacteriia bacterium]MBS5477992.1 DUF3662 domain-containing protein [Coriobacteriia bacterium]
MSFFDILEGRMQQLFEGNRMLAPLPFKKLAKSAVHEMKRNAVKIDGRHLAPTLYTVLVNPGDDQAMAALYQDVTNELVDFLAHEAQADGLELTGEPIVRFIAEPNIKPGKADVIAEVVTPDVLEEIRIEESAYAEQHVSAAGGTARPVAAAPAVPQQAAPLHGAQPAIPAIPANPTQAQARTMRMAGAPVVGGNAPAGMAPLPVPASGPSAACQLTDTSTGRTWRISTGSTVIGREEASADLVLADSNVSRRHAELARADAGWTIADLGSTNGTRVNGQRVTSQVLHSGDVITLGLVELQFREL